MSPDPADDRVGRAGPHQLREPSVPGGADHDLGAVDGAGELQDGRGDVVADHELQAAAKVLGQHPLLLDLRGGRADRAVGPHHMDGDQRTPGHPAGDPGPSAQQHRPLGAAGQRDHHPIPGGPGAADAVLRAVPVQTLLDPVGHPQQGKFAQRRQVALAEVVAQRGVDPVRRVDVAVRHPPAQRLRGHVHQFDLLGGPDHLVRHGLGLLDAGDGGDHVVQRFQVLHVHRGDHVDARGEQLIDVLPTLLVAATGRVGVRQLVHQRHVGVSVQDAPAGPSPATARRDTPPTAAAPPGDRRPDRR